MNKLLELLFLKQIKGYGIVKINKKLEIVNRVENSDELMDRLVTIEKQNRVLLDSSLKAANEIYYRLIKDKGLKIITVFDPEYPENFRSLGEKKPLILYAKGDISVLKKPGISIVGTRKPSIWTQKYGKELCEQIGRISSRVIVSGLAIGCDRIAHEGAIAAEVPTVAILSSGFENISPKSHQDLALDIIKHGGCLLTEYLPDTTVHRGTFLERDRLIAALTDVTFAIECSEKSGTMFTVEEAHKLEKKLLCYYPDEQALYHGAKAKDYAGNKTMLEKYGADGISTKEDLQEYFRIIEKPHDIKVAYYQMSLMDLIEE